MYNWDILYTFCLKVIFIKSQKLQNMSTLPLYIDVDLQVLLQMSPFKMLHPQTYYNFKQHNIPHVSCLSIKTKLILSCSKKKKKCGQRTKVSTRLCQTFYFSIFWTFWRYIAPTLACAYNIIVACSIFFYAYILIMKYDKSLSFYIVLLTWFQIPGCGGNIAL